jgi:hypothetical protein
VPNRIGSLLTPVYESFIFSHFAVFQSAWRILISRFLSQAAQEIEMENESCSVFGGDLHRSNHYM